MTHFRRKRKQLMIRGSSGQLRSQQVDQRGGESGNEELCRRPDGVCPVGSNEPSCNGCKFCNADNKRDG